MPESRERAEALPSPVETVTEVLLWERALLFGDKATADRGGSCDLTCIFYLVAVGGLQVSSGGRVGSEPKAANAELSASGEAARLSGEALGTAAPARTSLKQVIHYPAQHKA